MIDGLAGWKHLLEAYSVVWFAVNSDWSALVMRFCVKALAVSVLVDTGGNIFKLPRVSC